MNFKFLVFFTILFVNLHLKAQDIVVDPNIRMQKFDGWGASLSWWANLVGDYPQSEIDKICDDLIDPNELNFNIFRYNIHGGDNPAVHSGSTANHFRWDSGDIDSYKSSANAGYNWNANASQRKILLELLQRNPNLILDAQSNSPPHWMTISGCTSGNHGNTPNLKAGFEDDFADFLTDIVKHYNDNFGITFNTITPTNEPSSGYWGFGGNQEGCGILANQQMTIINEVYSQLQSKGMLGYCGLSGPDETSYTHTWNDINQYQYGNRIFDKIKQISSHSYEGEHLAGISGFVQDKGMKFYQSESGPLSIPLTGLDNHLFMAERVITDLRIANVNAWIDWQAASTSSHWGFYTLTQNSTTLTKRKSYHVRKMFSKFIKPGYQIIYTSDDKAVAAISPDQKELVIVHVNRTNTQKSLNFDLSQFCYEGAPVTVVRTNANNNHNTYTKTGTNGALNYNAPANTISTLVIDVVSNPPATLLKDGLYKIRNVASQKHIAVSGLSYANNTDIVQWLDNGGDNFIFEVKKHGFDYLIRSKFNGLPWTIAGQSSGNGALLKQYSDYGDGSQRFLLQPSDNETFKIIPKHSDKHLAIFPASNTNGAKVVQQTDTDTDNFKWIFEPITPTKPLANGVYQIKAVHSNKYMSVNGFSNSSGAVIEQWQYANQDNVKFQVEQNRSGFYTFSPVYNDYQFDVSGGSSANGASIVQYTALSAINQQFVLESVAGGAYRIAPKHVPSKYLNVSGESTANGADIIIWPYNGGDHSHWIFEELLKSPDQLIVSDPGACAGTTVSLSAVGGNGHGVGALKYYKGKCGGTPISNPASVTITGDEEYFVRYEASFGKSPCVSATVECDCEGYDLFLGSPTLTGDFETGQLIISNGQVQPGATTNFDAGLEIDLKPGFDAKNGSQFDAFLDGCD